LETDSSARKLAFINQCVSYCYLGGVIDRQHGNGRASDVGQSDDRGNHSSGNGFSTHRAAGEISGPSALSVDRCPRYWAPYGGYKIRTRARDCFRRLGLDAVGISHDRLKTSGERIAGATGNIRTHFPRGGGPVFQAHCPCEAQAAGLCFLSDMRALDWRIVRMAFAATNSFNSASSCSVKCPSCTLRAKSA
jgi:hypothetical protein